MPSLGTLYGRLERPPDLWESTVKSVVLDSRRRATMEDDQRRRDFQKALHAFLDGEHKAELELRLQRLYPQTAPDLNANEVGHQYFALVQMFVDRLAVVFDKPPETYLHIGDHVPLPETDAQVIQWRRDEESIRLPETLQKAERWMTCMQQSFVHPAWQKGAIRWIVHAPYEVEVVQDPESPGELEGAPLVSVILAQTEESDLVDPLDMRHSWRRVDERNEQGRVVRTSWEVWLHDIEGAVYNDPLFPDRRNRYGMHPLAVWRVSDPPAGCFWIPPNIGWYHQQLSADVKLVDLDLHLRHQIHSQRVVKGGDDLKGKVPDGPDVVVRSDDPSFGMEYVTPNPNIGLLIDGFNFQLRSSAVAEGLPPDTWEPNSSTRNLAAKLLEQAALKARRKRVIPRILGCLNRTWAAHKAVANNGPSGRTKYDDDVMLGVRVAPIDEPADRFQDTQATVAEIDAGLTSPVEVLMHRKGISRREAEWLLEQNRQDRDRFGQAPKPPADAAPPGVPRSPAVRDTDA